MDQSGDFGLAFFNIKEENTDYRFIFMDRQNHILKTTNDMKFVCTDAICELTFLLDAWTGITTLQDLTMGWNYDNDTGDITVDWNDPTGITQSIRLLVTKETMTGTAIICEQEASGASGTIVCNTGSFTGAILVRIYGTASPETPLVMEWITKGSQLLNAVIDKREGALWTFAVMVTAIGFGLFSPVATIIATIFGMVMMGFMGMLTAITMSFIILAGIIGIIVGIKVKK